MHVANLELCKELYELSGWGDTDYYYYVAQTSFGPKVRLRLSKGSTTREYTPAYDFGYLLRKLPDETILVRVSDTEWMCSWNTKLLQQKPTPEDAACKLAIELFKQRILTKEKN